MKIVKKIFLTLFVFFVGIITVNAESKNIKVTSVTVKEKSTTIEVADPVISDNEIKSNITFNQLNDYVTFELTLKNNESDKYKIISITDNNTNENLEVEYDYSEDFISSNDETKVRVKLTYKNKLTNANASLNNLTIILTIADSQGDTSQIVLNPNTGDNILHFLVLLIIAVTGLILIVRKKKIKIGVLVLAIGLIIIPFAVLAEEKFEISFKFTNIEVKGEFETYNVTVDKCNGTEPIVIPVTYGEKIGELPDAPTKEGHTFVGWKDEQNREISEDTVITGSITITPVYKKDKHTLTINHPEYIQEGDLSGQYEYGTQITLTAKEQDGYTFSKWSDDSTDNPITITIGTSDITIEPIYTENGPKIATLKAGPTVNVAMKNIFMNSTNMNTLTEIGIHNISRANEIPTDIELTDINIISTEDSDVPIYIWKSDEYNMEWYSEAEKLYLNEDSSFLFSDLFNLTLADFTYFDTSNVKNMSHMFYNARAFSFWNVENFDTSNVTDMSYMFALSDARTLNFDNWNTSNVTDMSGMFVHTNFINLDLSSFDTSKVTNMASMFISNKNLRSLDVSSFDTSKVTNMSQMFAECEKLKVLDISSFDTSLVGKIYRMFASESLETIYASDKFVINNATGEEVFSYASNLVGEKGTSTANYGDGKEYAHIDGGVLNPGYFTDKTPKITITFNPNGGSVNMESKLLTVGSKIKSMPIPFKNGYKFTGWYTDPEDGEKIAYDFEPQEDLIIYAHWEESSNDSDVYTYTDINNDGIISAGDSITIDTDEFIVLSTSNDGDINMMAKYNLDSNYRQNDNDYVTIKYSETDYWVNAFAASSSTASEDATDFERTGLHHNFKKDKNGDAYIYRTKRNKDTDNNLYPYINNYKSHLVNDLGINEIVDVKLIPIGEIVDLPTYCFDEITNQSYWLGSAHFEQNDSNYENNLYYIDDNDNMIGTTQSDNTYGIRPYVTISGSLINHEAIVKFDSQGGDKYNSIIYLYTDESTTIGNLPTPTKFDSVFDGWYTDNTYTTKVTKDTIVSNSVTYYAKWISCNGFASDSWDTINENILNNESYYPIGCRKEIETTDAYPSYQNSYDGVNKLYIRIINNTTPSECSRTDFSQTACGVVLDFENIIMRGNMSSLHSDSGDIADKLEFTDQIIPDELKNIIIDTKVISEYNQNLNETNSKYYNLAISEIYGNGTIYESHNNYTRQLDYYSKENTSLENYSSAKKKVVFLDSGSTNLDNIWVLRNKKGYDWNYYYVGVGGYPYVYNDRVGISPTFRIGKAN